MDNFILFVAMCIVGTAVTAVMLAAIYAAMLYITMKLLGLRPPGPPPVLATLGDR